ncbi:MAG TPA: zf-HC2 domain-containing protein [Bryobacteraceae bacterium]|nr:zf-HC2 domain-containing protein [Bryobacteraceae bacterium]
MCNFSGRLIAWLDGELPESEAINVEWHVRQCAECRRASNGYREISAAFLDCYLTAMPVGRPSRRGTSHKRWFALAGSVAAAILIAAVLLPRFRPQVLPALPVATVPAPSFAFEKTPPRMLAVRVRHPRAPQPIREQQWIAVEPTVEIALPADALFPPGAVPPGFSYIADIRPQP